MKKEFIKLYAKKACNITETCRCCNIDRQTYYNWREKDKEFDAELKHVEEGLIDFAETQLVKNIKDGKETSLIFFLKCKGKKRGYIEKQEIEHSGNVGVVIEDDV